MILGLDLGQNVGWCKGAAVGPMEHGTFKLKVTSDLCAWLRSSDEFFRAVMPGCTGVAIEQPFMGRDYFPARKLLALLGHAYYWGSYFGLSGNSFKEVPVATAKLTLANNGRAEKWQMIEAAAQLGYDGLDEHQADALGIWWVYVHGARTPIAKRRTRSSPGRSLLTEAP